jgi:ABC-type dipeptide/oligopeptide/nickel transport system permease component
VTQSIVERHALKNAALPVVTIIGVGFALLIAGATPAWHIPIAQDPH